MYIFIDESGVFSESNNTNGWSSVGALVVPDESLGDIEISLQNLKSGHGLSGNEEFKRNRPDESSEHFLNFISALNKLGCTLHIFSTPTKLINASNIENHKEKIKKAIYVYGEGIQKNDEYYTELIKILDTLNLQQYNQCLLQVYMIYDMIAKIIPYYAEHFPKSLANFYWIIDQKDERRNNYEKFFQSIYSSLISSKSASKPFLMVQKATSDYTYFEKSYRSKRKIEEDLRIMKNIYRKEPPMALKNSIMSYDFGILLEDHFSFGDSKLHLGLQCVDLLVSNANRCLKGNCDSCDKMAKNLGSLMINSPEIEKKCISIIGFTSGELDSSTHELVNIMDTSSKQYFGDVFRKNYSKSMHQSNA